MKLILNVVVGGALMMGLGAASPAIAAGEKSQAEAVQYLHDKAMIEDVLARYMWALDSANGDAYAALFTEDGVLVAGKNETKGRAAIKKMVDGTRAQGQTDGGPLKRHHTLQNLILEIKGNEATTRAYWSTVSNARDGIPSIAGVGRYDDKLVKKDGKWYFTRREIINDFSRPRPAAADGAGARPAPPSGTSVQ